LTTARHGPGRPDFTVVCVSARPSFRIAVGAAFGALTGGRGTRQLVGDGPVAAAPTPRPSAFGEVLSRALGYLDKTLPEATIRLLYVESGTEVLRRVLREGAGRIAMLIVDADSWPQPPDALGPDTIEAAISRWPTETRPEVSPYGVYVYHQPGKHQVQPAVRYTWRQLPVEHWVLAADLVCAFTDYVEVRHVRADVATGPA
jgi:hypothetical protein